MLPGFLTTIDPILALVVAGHEAQSRNSHASKIVVVPRHPGPLSGLNEFANASIAERVDRAYAHVRKCGAAINLLISSTERVATQTITE
ncbi:hypothetical protein D3C75_1264390 [compost metagenome]